MGTEFKSPLHQTSESTKTDVWNDSCAIAELTYAVENGAVGGTTNPVIVSQVLKKELPQWTPRIKDLAAKNPAASEDVVAWLLIEEMAVGAAKILKPIYDKTSGKKGRLSIQTNAKFYRDAKSMVEQACHFNDLYPNNNVKMPVTKAGVEAVEESTYRGVSVNGTVSFTVAQAIQVAEAVERGLKRREKEGKDISGMAPVCTIMVGRTDDWVKKVVEKKGIMLDPGIMEWAGVAVMKKAYRIYQERGYRTRLLAAAYRNHMHWSEFIGGDMCLTIPYDWQVKFNASDIEVKSRIDDPVDPKIVAELSAKVPAFVQAYEENGLSVEEFDTYGATRRTLRGFLAGYEDLVKMVRDIMMSDPDIKGE